MIQINRHIGRGAAFNIFDFNYADDEAPGPNKPEWSKYLGEYEGDSYGVPFFKISVTIRNGHLYFNDRKCTEYIPGLLFTYEGDAVDFRTEPSTIGGSCMLHKK